MRLGSLVLEPGPVRIVGLNAKHCTTEARILRAGYEPASNGCLSHVPTTVHRFTS